MGKLEILEKIRFRIQANVVIHMNEEFFSISNKFVNLLDNNLVLQYKINKIIYYSFKNRVVF